MNEIDKQIEKTFKDIESFCDKFKDILKMRKELLLKSQDETPLIIPIVLFKICTMNLYDRIEKLEMFMKIKYPEIDKEFNKETKNDDESV